MYIYIYIPCAFSAFLYSQTVQSVWGTPLEKSKSKVANGGKPVFGPRILLQFPGVCVPFFV